MKFNRLFRIGSQAYRAYRSYRGKGSGNSSRKFGGSKYGGSSHQRSNGTIERLIRRFLK